MSCKNDLIRTVKSILFLAYILSALGCVEYAHTPKRMQGKNIQTVEPLMSIAATPFPTTRAPLIQNENYALDTIEFEAFAARLWRPKGAGPHPAVLLLPGIWGDRIMVEFAEDLVSKGYVCLQLGSHRYLERLRSKGKMSTEVLAEMIKQQVVETGEAFHWLSTQPEIDAERIGILGVSIGAIIATLFSETDGNIKAASYLLGGGNLPDIMAAPKGYVKRRLRNRIMTENGLTEEEFKSEVIRTLQPVDPLNFTGRIDPARILMVNGRFDQVIPYRNAKELWKALGEPTLVVLPAGHYTASFFMPYVRYKVAKHFEKFLG